MPVDQAINERIEAIIRSDRVVLFMKGNRDTPRCGFSAATVGILDALLPEYTTVDVLEDQAIREGIKSYSSWPTIPQLYIGGEFMGGCDVTRQMFNTGALHEALGMAPPERTAPDIRISDAAADVIRNALESQPGNEVHLAIDGRWQHSFSLAPAEGHEVRAESNGITLLMDLATAQRAKGLSVDMQETLQGHAFAIDNPNAPPPVRPMSVADLAARLGAGEPLHLFDVREEHEIARARIEGARRLDEAAVDLIESLPKDTPLVFVCHYGERSQGAAEHFRMRGFSAVYNVSGGIDAWSREVDPSVPRY